MTSPTDTTAAAVSAPFWAAAERHELIIQWCEDCDAGVHYPRVLCPRCGGRSLTWHPSDGSGTVYAVAVHPDPDGDRAVVLVDLDDGIRLLSQVIDMPAAEVTVGMPVLVAWSPATDGRTLPVFVPADGSRR